MRQPAATDPPAGRRARRAARLALAVGGLLVLQAGAAAALDTVAVTAETERLPLGPHLQALKDPAGDKTLAQALAALGGPGWRPVNAHVPNYGYTDATYWFAVDLAPRDGVGSRRWLLEIPYALPDRIGLYLLAGDGRIERELTAGDALPFDARPVPHHHFLFPIELAAGETTRLLLRVQSSGTMQVPLTLWEQHAFHRADQQRLLGQGLYFGIMLVMVLYNLFIYLAIRDASYLYYVLFVGNFALFQAALQGFAYQYLWPDNVWWQGQSLAVLAGASLVFACLFSRQFMGLPGSATATNRFLLGMAAAAGALTVFSLFGPYSTSIRLIVLLAIPTSVGILACGVLMWSRGSTPARYFTVAWLLYLVGILLISLNKFAWLPRNALTENAMQIGSALEVILLSFALADRINHERAEKLAAQQSALESERRARHAHEEKLTTQRRATETLETRVQERTRELESALDELGQANRLLARLNRMDGLTGIHNRRSFDETLDKEFRRARREGRPLSLIICDIDHFKTINDRHGHLVGDDCLKTVARHLLEMLRRPADLAARYGGEEFAVIAPDTDADGAWHLAQELRRRVERERVRAAGRQTVSLTVSGGVATLIPSRNDTPDALIAAADDALYRAKRSGRNRICAASPEAAGLSLPATP